MKQSPFCKGERQTTDVSNIFFLNKAQMINKHKINPKSSSTSAEHLITFKSTACK